MQLPIPNVEVIWRAELPAAAPDAIALGKYWHVDKGEVAIDLPGLARYRIGAGNRVEIALFPGGEQAAAEFFLMSTPFGALIHQRGEFAFHASTVLSPLSGKALLIAGISGSGKSTLAGALAQRSWTVINDDVSRITLCGSEPMVWPGSGSLKLWRQSCELLNLDSQTLARTQSGKEKYFWPGTTVAQTLPLPIAATLELIPSNERPWGLERVTGREVLKTYFHHTFRFPLVRALGSETPHFRHAARLAASVPTYRLRASRQFRPERMADELEKLLTGLGCK